MAQPLQPATLDVPIAPLNQHTTRTGGPVGRLKKLVNGVVKKLTSSGATATASATTSLRIEKRDGFSQLPSMVRDPATGNVSSKALNGATLFGTYGAQLIAVFLAAPFVLSESAGCWESPTYNAPTQVLRATPVAGDNGSVVGSDEARIGTRTFFTWTQVGNIHRWSIQDDDGTVIISPNTLGGPSLAGPSMKVVADGTQFWTAWVDNIGNININAFDVNGVGLGNATIAPAAGTIFFDITKNTHTANSIVLASRDPASNGFRLTTFTWNGSAVVQATTIPLTVFNGTSHVAFLTNDRNDHQYHVVCTDTTGPFTTYVMPISDITLTVSGGPFTVATSATANVEATGFVSPTGNADYTIAISFVDTTPTPQLNSTLIYSVTSVGVSSLKRTQKSLTAASRAFRMQVGGDYYAVGYYHSNPAGATGIAQSTYFLMDLGTNYQVTGRFEYGTAYQDWITSSTFTYYMGLSTPQVDPNGGVHIALAYRASSTIATTVVGDTFTQVKTLVDVVGIKDYQFGPDSGQVVEHSGALFMPGPEAVNYTGATFAEDGIGLIPEVLSIANGGAGSLSGTFEYVVVDEWTDNNGQRVRSPSGLPFSISGNNFQVTLTGLHNHVTRKQNMIHSIYRTTHDLSGVQSTIHSKVSGSLQGGTYLGSVVVNDDTANTWTFTDNMIDSVAANNEELYTDKGLRDHFPAPPFSVGLATFDRVLLAGYDGAIWFSGPKTEGDSFWFHPDFRIPLPTKEQVTSIKMLDQSIVVLCDGESVFQIPNGPWPDATGSGDFPVPVILPFTNGCPDGTAETISDGIIYSAQQGGIWLITRDFQNKYIGAPVEDEKADDETFVGVATDDRQRTVFLTSGTNLLVYDQVTGVWGTWNGLGPVLITTHKGRIALMPQSGAPYRQVLDQYHDGTNTPIITSARIRVAPGGIRRYQRLWQVQLFGEWLGDHDMTVTALPDDNALVTATYTWTPATPTVPSTAYVYELPANEATELCAAVDYTFTDYFPRGPSQGAAWEALSLYVGLGDRLKGLPATSQISST